MTRLGISAVAGLTVWVITAATFPNPAGAFDMGGIHPVAPGLGSELITDAVAEQQSQAARDEMITGSLSSKAQAGCGDDAAVESCRRVGARSKGRHVGVRERKPPVRLSKH